MTNLSLQSPTNDRQIDNPTSNNLLTKTKNHDLLPLSNSELADALIIGGIIIETRNCLRREFGTEKKTGGYPSTEDLLDEFLSMSTMDLTIFKQRAENHLPAKIITQSNYAPDKLLSLDKVHEETKQQLLTVLISFILGLLMENFRQQSSHQEANQTFLIIEITAIAFAIAATVQGIQKTQKLKTTSNLRQVIVEILEDPARSHTFETLFHSHNKAALKQ